MINGTFDNAPVRHISGKAELLGNSASRTVTKSGNTNLVINDVPQQGLELNVKLSTNNIINYSDIQRDNYQTRIFIEQPLTLLAGVTYTATAYSETAPTNIYFLTTANTYSSYYTYSTNSYSCSFTPTEEVDIILAYYWSAGTPDNTEYKLEEGGASTDFTTYYDWLEGTTVTISGKNLFDYTQKKLSGASAIISQENGVVEVYQNSKNMWCSANLELTDCYNLVGKKITISAKAKTSGANNAALRVMWLTDVGGGGGGKYILTSPYISSNDYVSISTTGVIPEQPTTEHSYLCIMLYSNVDASLTNDAYSAWYKDIQIEIGGNVTAFEPYQEPQEYTVAANGRTERLTTIAPTMYINTDDAATIKASFSYTDVAGGASFTHEDRLKSFDLERLGESRFFGYGVAQKANIKLIDKDRELDFTTADKFKLYLNDRGFTPPLKVTEVHRDENTNELSITAYDALEQAGAHTVVELALPTSYTIGEFAQACAALLGCSAVLEDLEAFNIYFDGGANFEGTESIREALNDVAEATQTIYFLNNNNEIVFKRLDMSAEPVATIDKENYFTLDSKTNRRLVGICSATELGDNVEAKLELSGTTEYVRNNAFWSLRQDINTLVDNALEAVGGLTIAQFNCNWRGNYLLEIGDKIAFETKDNNFIISYLLNDTVSYNGGLEQVTQWEYTDTEESVANPTTLGEALKYTYARVDKAEKQIDIVASEIGAAKSEIAAMQITTDKISASVSAIEKTATDAVESLNKEVNTLTQKVEAQITAEDLTIEVQKALESGVDSVTTTTGFTFDENGLKVTKSSSDINTTITEDGMQIKKGSKELLTANNEGVKAIDLHATTFLIIGKNSRFEDFKSSRTACFWIGG